VFQTPLEDQLQSGVQRPPCMRSPSKERQATPRTVRGRAVTTAALQRASQPHWSGMGGGGGGGGGEGGVW